MGVGEAPGREEELAGEPFVGYSGSELTRMLHEAGILRSDVFLTNVCKYRPPNNKMAYFIPTAKKWVTPDCIYHIDRFVKPQVHEGCLELEREVALVKPEVILAFGNTALWALTNKWGITKWRGSHLRHPSGALVIPTYHPAAILRQWDWRFTAVLDLKRARRLLEQPEPDPAYQFKTRPSFKEVIDRILWLGAEEHRLVSVDIENSAGQIDCIGLAWSATEALCIPLIHDGPDRSYWTLEEEREIWEKLRWLLQRVRVIGQNFMHDAQYFAREMRIIPNLWWDTLVMQHLEFLALPKSLDYLSSFWCPHHLYWKDDSKFRNPEVNDDQHWRYNCIDCVKTFEIYVRQRHLATELNLERQVEERRASWWAALYPMVRGVRIDHSARTRIAGELQQRSADLDAYLQAILGHKINIRSPKQMHCLFYQDFGLPPIYNRKPNDEGERTLTLNDEALETIATKHPLMRPLVASIAIGRTLGVLKSTFVDAPLDLDGRMRTAYNVAGTVEFRLSSKENVFGSGLNMQNIPSDKSKAIGKTMRRMEWLEDEFPLPNIRTLFMPDPGMQFFSADLDRADLQVIAAEANDKEMRKALSMGVDFHLFGLRDIDNVDLPVDELVEAHPKYPEHKAKHKYRREIMKVGIYLTNYGGTAKTLATTMNTSVREAEYFQRRWFGARPGIKAWHNRTSEQLMSTRRVCNKFGYYIVYFDRIESLLGEALAWIPASTVALVTMMGWVRVATTLPDVEVLLQVHDELAGQYPLVVDRRAEIKRCMEVTVPYDDPLVIPVGIKTSDKSWGACQS